MVASRLRATVGSAALTANSYVLADGHTGEAVLIDPVLEMIDRDLLLLQVRF